MFLSLLSIASSYNSDIVQLLILTMRRRRLHRLANLNAYHGFQVTTRIYPHRNSSQLQAPKNPPVTLQKHADHAVNLQTFGVQKSIAQMRFKLTRKLWLMLFRKSKHLQPCGYQPMNIFKSGKLKA